MRWLRALGVGCLVSLVGGQAPQLATKLPADEMTLVAHAYTPVLTLTAQSNLVEIPVVVRDTYGRPVGTLTARDFQLTVDGKAQAITGFTLERGPAAVSAAPGAVLAKLAVAPADAGAVADTPRASVVAWFFDDLNSDTFDLGSARNAALKTLANGLEPGERIAVYSASSDTATLDLTTDMEAVRSHIGSLALHPKYAGFNNHPILTANQAYMLDQGQDPDLLRSDANVKLRDHLATDYVEAVEMVRDQAHDYWAVCEEVAAANLKDLISITQYLGRQPGDRSIVMASSGLVTPTLQALQTRVERTALKNGVTINMIDAKGLVANYPPGYNVLDTGGEVQFSNGAMWDMATDTGGRFWQNNNDLGRAFHEFSTAPEYRYQLSFIPGALPADGALHALKVSVTAPGTYDLQARTGFLAAAAAGTETASLALQQELSQEVFGTDALSGIPAVARAVTTAGRVRVAVAVDPQALTYLKIGGRQEDDLTLVAALVDGNGKFVAGQEGEMKLRLKDQTLAAISKPGTGITTALDVTAAAGSYRLRTIIEEANHGAMATFTQAVVVF